jgi:hypothetical protein
VPVARIFAVTSSPAGTSQEVEARLHVAVWTAEHELIAAESFGSVHDLLGWLRTRAEHGEDTILWTDQLQRDPELAAQVAAALDVKMPPPPLRRTKPS